MTHSPGEWPLPQAPSSSRCAPLCPTAPCSMPSCNVQVTTRPSAIDSIDLANPQGFSNVTGSLQWGCHFHRSRHLVTLKCWEKAIRLRFIHIQNIRPWFQVSIQLSYLIDPVSFSYFCFSAEDPKHFQIILNHLRSKAEGRQSFKNPCVLSCKDRVIAQVLLFGKRVGKWVDGVDFRSTSNYWLSRKSSDWIQRKRSEDQQFF